MVYSTLNLRSTKKYKPAWQQAAKVALAKKRLTSRRLSQIIESERIIRLIGASTNYREEGDERMDTGEQLKARKQLSSEVHVKDLIRRFWDILVDGQKASSARIDKITYVNFYLAVSRALLNKNVFDKDECMGAVLQDWERETVGQSGTPLEERTINRSQFHDSLFETVDIWTPSIAVEDYVTFLESLFSRIFVMGSGESGAPAVALKRGKKKVPRKADRDRCTGTLLENIDEDEDDDEEEEEEDTSVDENEVAGHALIDEEKELKIQEDRLLVQKQEKKADRALRRAQRFASSRYYLAALDILNMKRDDGLRKHDIEVRLKSIRRRSRCLHINLLRKTKSKVCAVGLNPWMDEQEEEIRSLLQHRNICIETEQKCRNIAKQKFDRLLGDLLSNTVIESVISASTRRDTSANKTHFYASVQHIVEEAQQKYLELTDDVSEHFREFCVDSLKFWLHAQLQRMNDQREAAQTARNSAQKMVEERLTFISDAPRHGGIVIQGQHLESELQQIERDARKMFDNSTHFTPPNFRVDNRHRLLAWISRQFIELREYQADAQEAKERVQSSACERIAVILDRIRGFKGRITQANILTIVDEFHGIREYSAAAYLEMAQAMPLNFSQEQKVKLEAWFDNQELELHTALRDIRARGRWTRVEFKKKKNVDGFVDSKLRHAAISEYLYHQKLKQEEIAIEEVDKDDMDRIASKEAKVTEQPAQRSRRHAIQGTLANHEKRPDEDKEDKALIQETDLLVSQLHAAGGTVLERMPCNEQERVRYRFGDVAQDLTLESARLECHEGKSIALYDAHGRFYAEKIVYRPHSQRLHTPGSNSMRQSRKVETYQSRSTSAVYQRRPPTVRHSFRHSGHRKIRDNTVPTEHLGQEQQCQRLRDGKQVKLSPHSHQKLNKGLGQHKHQPSQRLDPSISHNVKKRASTAPAFGRSAASRSNDAVNFTNPRPPSVNSSSRRPVSAAARQQSRRKVVLEIAQLQHTKAPAATPKDIAGVEEKALCSTKWTSTFADSMGFYENVYCSRTGRSIAGLL